MSPNTSPEHGLLRIPEVKGSKVGTVYALGAMVRLGWAEGA